MGGRAFGGVSSFASSGDSMPGDPFSVGVEGLQLSLEVKHQGRAKGVRV